MRHACFFVMTLAAAALALGACDNEVEGGGSGAAAGAGGNGSSTTNSSSSSSSSSTGSGGAGGGGGVVLMPGECRTQADCMNGELCLSPDAEPLCGVCYQPQNPCTTDAACAAVDPATICEKPACSCGESECLPGCMSDAECPAWQFCSPGHRCTPDPCATDADCGANIGCDMATKTCARKACMTDAQCEDICVNGACFDKAGACTIPPP